MHVQAKDFLQEKTEVESSSVRSSFESEQQGAPEIPDSDSLKPQEQRLEANDDASEVVPSTDGEEVLQENNREEVLQENNSSSVSSVGVPPPRIEKMARSSGSQKYLREGETSVIEQFEHGVYVTLIVLPSGIKVFKRVRFSKRRFDEQQAEEWWNQNKDRVLSKYNPAVLKNATTGSSITPPHAEESNNAALPSS